jgi:hypothetical protein
MRTPLHAKWIVGLGLAAALAAGAGLIHAEAADDRSTPVVTSIAPRIAGPDNHSQNITVNGRDFQPRLALTVVTPEGGSMHYKGDAIQSQRESSFQVAVIFATAGKYSLVVTNPDGGMSNPFVVEVPAQQKPPTPVIDRVLPEEILKNQEAQDLTVQGQRFAPGLRVIVTDPLGTEVLDPIVRELTQTSFKLNVKLETAGPYNLVVTNPSGAVSNVATFVVK